MNEWSKYPLAQLIEVQNGFAFSSKNFGDKGKPLIRIRDLKVGVGTEIRYSGSFDPAYVVSAGDLLIGMDGEFRCYEWKGDDALLNQRVCRLKNFAGALEPRFLLYGINRYLKDIEDVTGYATVKHLSSKRILSIPFPVPPLAEQRRIIAILDRALEGIDASTVYTQRNLLNSEGLFRSCLDEAFSEGNVTWERKSLRDVARVFGRGKSKHRPRNDPKLYGGQYPFIQTGDVRNADHLITSYTQTYNEAGLAQSQLWKKGTLCITIAANIAETGVLDFDACFPDSIIGVSVDERQTSSKYLEYLLQAVKSDLKAKGKGSAQDNINLATFERELFPFPDVKTQAAIVRRMDELSGSIQQLKRIYDRKLEEFVSLKSSLIAAAFSAQL
jgi:type I restriction enzyme, S subunit